MDWYRQTRAWSSAARGTTADMRQAARRGLTHELPAAAPHTHTGITAGARRPPAVVGCHPKTIPGVGWQPACRRMWAATRGQEHSGAGPTGGKGGGERDGLRAT